MMEMESKTKKKLSENILEKFSMDFLRNQVLKNAYGNNDTVIAKLEVTRDVDGSVSVTNLKLIPCASSGVVDGNNYQPVPYEEGSEEYERTISKLEGSFTGANLTIPYEYGFNEY